MAEKKLTLRQVEAKIAKVNESIENAKQRLVKLDAEKKALTAEKRRLSAVKTKAAKTSPAGKTAKKKTAVKKPAEKKAAAKDTKEKSEENLLDGLIGGLKQAGLDPEDLLKSILGGN